MITRRMTKGKDHSSSSQNADSSSQPAKPEKMKIEVVDRKKLIRLEFADGNSPHPIIGSGAIGALKENDIPTKDIFIEPVYNDGTWKKQMAKIYQEASPVNCNTEKLSAVAVDTIFVAKSFRLVGNCLFKQSDSLTKTIKFTWFVDQRRELMFNLHLDEATVVWDNIETLEKEMNQVNQEQLTFYGDMIAVVRPKIAKQIDEHIRLVYHNRDKQKLIKEARTIRCVMRPHIRYPSLADGNLRKLGDLYQALNDARPTVPSYKLRLSSLACDLRKYQKDAVDFLIHREVEPAADVGAVHKFICVTDDLFYLPSLGAFVRDISNTSVNVVGGILADETGLGKTLELICLILSHKNEDDTKELRRTRINANVGSKDKILNNGSNVFTEETTVSDSEKCVQSCNPSENTGSAKNPGDVHCADCGEGWPVRKVHWLPEFQQQNLTFKCPTCTAEGPRIPVSATLIVVPKPFCEQWYDEIRNHTGDDVKVDIYKGVAVDGYKNPHYFSKFQIVLTSYEVLEKENEFLHEHQQSDLKRDQQQPSGSCKRRHDGERNIVSPLTSIDWWRVCLDECQLVEGDQLKDVCFQLQSRAKWCISGTPLVKNYYDFQPILRFLKARPFDRTDIWKSIYLGYLSSKELMPMVEVLAQIFRRNSKKEVVSQLRLPPNKENVINVFLSPMEMEHYKLKFIQAKWEMGKLFYEDDDYEEEASMDLLNSVRRPLITGEGYSKEDPKKKLTGQTPHDVCTNVVQRAGTELRMTLTYLIWDIRKQARHNLPCDDFEGAIDGYNRLSSTVRECESKINTLRNLIGASSKCPDAITSDAIAACEIQLKNLKEGFNESRLSKKSVATAIRNLAASKERHAENNENFKFFLPSIQAYVEKIPTKGTEELSETSTSNLKQSKPQEAKSKKITWEELKTTLYARQSKLDELLTDFQPWTEIDLSPDGKLFIEISDCSHNDSEWDGEGNRKIDYSYDCPLCLMDCSIANIEGNLSIAVIKKHIATGNCAAGWKRHTVDLAEDPIHMAMKSILQLPEDTSKKMSLEHFEMFEKYMENLRECVQQVNIVMKAIQVVVTKNHEIRTEARRSSRPMKKSTREYVAPFATFLKHAERDMMAIHTKISNVETLMKNDGKLECSVCHVKLETSLQLLPCFHSLCNLCYIKLAQQPTKDDKLKCVVCRTSFKPSQVDEVMLNGPATIKLSNESVDQFTIKGVTLSFKLAAIMRNVVSLLDEDPTNKIVVFSEMDSVLEKLSHTMESIGFQHVFISSTICDFDGLTPFKKNSEVKVLLLHLSLASNALNLVEANHVFFMEPTPNAMVYQQARGRVHRLGQNRPTTIHHLITKDTIEETIHEVSSNPTETDLNCRVMKAIFGISENLEDE